MSEVLSSDVVVSRGCMSGRNDLENVKNNDPANKNCMNNQSYIVCLTIQKCAAQATDNLTTRKPHITIEPASPTRGSSLAFAGSLLSLTSVLRSDPVGL